MGLIFLERTRDEIAHRAHTHTHTHTTASRQAAGQYITNQQAANLAAGWQRVQVFVCPSRGGPSLETSSLSPLSSSWLVNQPDNVFSCAAAISARDFFE